MCVPNISNSRPTVSCFMHVMSERTHCSKMWLLHNRTVNHHCLLIIYRLFQLVNFKLFSNKLYFLTTVSIEVCSASLLIHIEVAWFQHCRQFMFEALLSGINFSLWGKPTTLYSCSCRSSMHIFAQSCKNWNIFLLALALPSLLFSL